MIRVPVRRFGRGSILGLTALLIAFALLQPQLFGGDGASGTRNLPRAGGGEVRPRPVETPIEVQAAAPAKAPEAAAPSPEVRAAFEGLGARLEIQPYDADAWMEVGALLVQVNDHARAAEAYAAAAESDPRRAEAHAQLGKALLFEGMVRVARIEFLRALAIDPTLAEVQLNLGITYSHGAPADIRAARVAWTRATELAPGTDVARQAAEYLAAYAEPASTPVPEPRG
jgi:tetratricopeptide (TPR) repeat protein